MFDALVIGSGPAGLAIASALAQAGLKVQGLSPVSPETAWPNTYGVWVDELEALGLSSLLSHRWDDCSGYFGHSETSLNRSYSLFDKAKLQAYLLEQGSAVKWQTGSAAQIQHFSSHSHVTTAAGAELRSHVVIDASGHQPAFIQRPAKSDVAFQAAYGIVGRFSAPPVRAGQFVLMDYRADYLPADESTEPSTFLYAMDLGDNVYFVEETSLARSPAVPFETLKYRLQQRLAARDVQVEEIHHEEYCLFPMNLPLPDLRQPVVGFGGAASMVHPATGYMVGALLRRAPGVAAAIATALSASNATPSETARAAWQALWPSERVRKHYVYQFGLEALLRFDQPQLCRFFDAFFRLSQPQWAGFLADTLSTPELVAAMLNLFGKAPNSVRGGLMRAVGTDGRLLLQSLQA
ncbi:MAG: lycopene cyclase family protein [Leptolyngbya sp. SIO4C1]|nr:lycopene cyclase family protein [Leptolyngbya sp. SIO4C1]